MIMWIVGLLVVAVLAVLAFAASRPNTFSVVRQGHINAAPENVFPLINDFHEWTRWSPWEKMDPNLTRTYRGSEAGEGAIYEWTGNKKVGQGRMDITSTAPPSRIDIDLHFMKPFEARNKTVFTLTPASGGTDVRWEMTGTSPFMFKVMGLFMNMDAMIGKDFDAGLANMKAVAEG
jgi:Polyketide cyclase / dehydrase and lipid transport